MKVEPINVEFVDLAYLAGSMEADGCWYLANTASMRLTNKAKNLLTWCTQKFGGLIKYKHNPINCYEWTLHGKDAVIVTEMLVPYLKFKQEEVAIWLEFAKTIQPRGKRVSEETIQKRKSLVNAMKQARDKRNGEDRENTC